MALRIATLLTLVLTFFIQLAEGVTRGFAHSFPPDNTLSTCGKLTTYMMKGAYVSSEVWDRYSLSCDDAARYINATTTNPPYTSVYTPIVGVCDDFDKRCRSDTILLTTATWQFYDPRDVYDFFMVDWSIDRFEFL
ncbi:hypothetical protein BD626DRAFT_405127 [Schizophyllum amplum]|uniref:Uncharacterized protein n=1 Tax=Schizophyllum amplum TaxID=97359 RepID=A0A550BY91_9AGAR|nr:hypothetical protein BD626DRAFT_411721 [Auriculariopsis ampla]TRM61911.1 hypothetical protein BD626DRAFT_405127 [Auriculariopsis ampla]